MENTVCINVNVALLMLSIATTSFAGVLCMQKKWPIDYSNETEEEMLDRIP